MICAPRCCISPCAGGFLTMKLIALPPGPLPVRKKGMEESSSRVSDCGSAMGPSLKLSLTAYVSQLNCSSATLRVTIGVLPLLNVCLIVAPEPVVPSPKPQDHLTIAPSASQSCDAEPSNETVRPDDSTSQSNRATGRPVTVNVEAPMIPNSIGSS